MEMNYSGRALSRSSGENNAAAFRKRTVPPNKKPWFIAEVGSLFKTRDDAFSLGDKTALREARNNLTAGIRRAKVTYTEGSRNKLGPGGQLSCRI